MEMVHKEKEAKGAGLFVDSVGPFLFRLYDC